MKATIRTAAMLTTAAVLALGLGATTGCGKKWSKKRKVDCGELCKRMETCFFDVMKKQGKLSKATIKFLKKDDKLRRKMKQSMKKYCKKTCKKYNKKKKWSRKDVKKVKKCLKKSSCEKFAKCITKTLY